MTEVSGQSAPHRVVPVALEARSYEILIGSGLLGEAGKSLSKVVNATHAVLIADRNVLEYARTVESSFKANGVRTDLIPVEPGEASKCSAEAERLWERLFECKTDRKSIVVAVGGGVIGDLAGFIAATFARGLDFVQVPTTLLAHVDSSVGGKVAINLPKAKNMVGAFWQPKLVLIDLDTLTSLPDREYRAGLAEVVKYGVIMDAPFFDYLESHQERLLARDVEVLRYVIARCCELKAEVVRDDETETSGRRAILNYGHTYCHAIESASGYGRFLHGEAVAMGMIHASRLAELLNRIDADTTQRQRELLTALGLPVCAPGDLDPAQLIDLMQGDKKVEHGKLRFVLPSRMGHVELVGDVDKALVFESLA